MTVTKVTDNAFWTQYGLYDKPKLVVLSSVTPEERMYFEGLEALNIWVVIWE